MVDQRSDHGTDHGTDRRVSHGTTREAGGRGPGTDGGGAPPGTDRSAAPPDMSDGAVAKPRFWGPASWWRLGLAAFAVLILALLLFGR